MDVKWDVRGARGSMQVSPSLTYMTPLSKAMIVSLTASAKHMDGDYANYYHSVSAPQAVASGLPVYRARSGWASAGATVIVGCSLSGDLRKGGFTLVAIGSYSKLLNDARLGQPAFGGAVA